MKKLLNILLILGVSIILVGCVGNKVENEQVQSESKISDRHIKVLEATTTYEEMTQSERIAALEVVEDYWDELSTEQQEKYSERKDFILRTKDEAVSKWAAEKETEKTTEEVSSDNTINTTNITANVKSLKFGELLDVSTNDNLLIIKAKISPSYSNKSTINQNGYNVADIILNQGGDLFDEIKYWAVADMTDGSERKVISFTLTKELINSVKNKQLFGNQIVNKATDVWILPSLQN